MFRSARPATAAISKPSAAPSFFGGRTKVAETSLPLDTRVVPRHVYENRQNTTNVSVPNGYRTVWDDDRLNSHRAERTLHPAQVRGVVRVPRGHKPAEWADTRLNLRRGVRTAQGDAQTAQIWSDTLPRTLLAVPTQPRVVTLPRGAAQGTVVARVSTRSAPAAGASSGIYVRVATYGSKADARAVAQALARTGLPMHLGLVRSSGDQVVLAGPYRTRAQARTALKQLRGAGYQGARLSR